MHNEFIDYDDKYPVKRIEDESIIHNANATQQVMEFLEIYRNLSVGEQDEILRMIIRHGGMERLKMVTQTLNTPGAFDLLSDNIHYYHFLRAVKEEWKPPKAG